MRPATIQPPYHQSTLNAYLAFPEKLRLTAVEGVRPTFRHYAQVRGTAVHSAIARLHEEHAWDQARDVFAQEWELQFSLPDSPVNASAKKLDKEYEDWCAAVEQYALREHNAPVLYCELPVRGAVRSRGGRCYEVQGTVDQVRRADGGGYEVYEHKTNATCPSLATLERNIQLSLYGWCLHAGEILVDDQWQPASEVFDGALRGMVSYHLAHLIPYRRAGRRSDGSTYSAGDLRGDPCYRITKTPEQLEQGALVIARIIAAIRAGGFYWNPSAMYGGCDACSVKHSCGHGLLSNHELEPGQLQAA